MDIDEVCLDDSLDTVKILHQTVSTLKCALKQSKEEVHQLKDQAKNLADPYNRLIENLTIENHVLREKVLGRKMSEENMEDKDSDLDDVFEDEKSEFNGPTETEEHDESLRIMKGDSEESDEVDNIELILTTDDTKELGGLQIDLESIAETDRWKKKEEDDDIPEFLKRTWSHSVLVETDISKCGIIDENEPSNQNVRMITGHTYKPIIHREVLSGNRSNSIDGKPVVTFQEKNSSRPILNEKNISKQECETQTDITAVPSHWRSESFLAHGKIFQNFTTLPSKFALPFTHKKHSLKLSEKTQEARRVLLSDINFTSMVPELSRSADYLCQETGSLLCRYPRAFSYMKNPEITSPCYGKSNWSPYECQHRKPSWEYYNSSSITSIPPGELSETRRRHSMRPSISFLDNYWTGAPQQRQNWASMPSSPTHYQRSKSVPVTSVFIPKASQHLALRARNVPHQKIIKSHPRNQVKFSDHHMYRGYPGRSLPDLRSSVDSGEDSTDSLIDESEDFLRRSIDSMTQGDLYSLTKRRRAKSYYHLNHSYNNIKPPREAQPFLARAPSDLRIDNWVKVITNDGHLSVGKVRYIGPLPDSNELFIGVQLQPCEGGDSDGFYRGAWYFNCDANCGTFVPFKKVVMAWSI